MEGLYMKKVDTEGSDATVKKTQSTSVTKDYTDEITIGDNTFALILDESMIDEFCTVKKYANIVEIRVHPLIIKIFDTSDVINFGAWKFLIACGTLDDSLEAFIRDNFAPDVFIAMISVSYNFSAVMFNIMEIVDRINNNCEIIRESKYKLASLDEKMNLLKFVGSNRVRMADTKVVDETGVQ